MQGKKAARFLFPIALLGAILNITSALSRIIVTAVGMSEKIHGEVSVDFVTLLAGIFMFALTNDIKNKETVKEIIKIMDETNYNFSDPDTFNCMFAFPLEQLLESIVINLHKEISIEVKDKHKPEFIFINKYLRLD